MADTIQSAIYRMALDNSQYVHAADSIAQAHQKIVASGAQVVTTEERVTAVTKSTADSFTRLEAKYDPLIRSELRRQAALAQTNRVAEEAGIGHDRLAAQLQRLNTFYDQQVGSTQRATVAQHGLNVAIGGSPAMFNRSRIAIQQSAFALTGLASNLTSGFAGMRSLTIAGGSMLSMFGPWGAVIGAGVSVLGALTFGLIASKDASAAAAEATDSYREAIKKLDKALGDGEANQREHIGLLYEEAKAATEAAIANERLAIAALRQRQLERVGSVGRFQQVPRDPEAIGLELQAQSAILRIEELEAAIRRLDSSSGNMPRGPELRFTALAEDAEDAADAIAKVVEQERRLNEHLDRTTSGIVKQANAYRDSLASAAEEAEKARTKAAEDAAEDRQRIADREAEMIMEPFKNALRGIQGAFSDMFATILDGGINSFKDFGRSVLDIFKEMAAQIAALFVFRPAVGGLLSGIGLGGLANQLGLGGFSGIGSIGQQVFGGGGLGGIGDFLFGGQAGGRIGGAGSAAGNFGGVSPGLFGTGSSFLANSFLPILGSALPGLISGDFKGAAFGGGGAALGAGIGSIIPGVGTALGGVLGGLLGNLIPGLFGGGFKKPSASGYFDIADNAGLLTDATSKHGGDSSAARNAVTAYSQTLSALLDATDLSIMDGRISGYIQAQQNKGGDTNFYGNLATRQGGGPGSQDFYTRVALGGSTNKGEEGLKQVVSDLIKATLQAAADTGALGGAGATATTLTVLRNSQAASIEQLGADLEFAKLYDQLAGLAEPTTQFAEAVKALDAQFASAKDRAEQFGLALGPLDQALADAKAKLTTDFNDNVRRSILAFTDPLTLALDDLAKAQEDRLKEAQAAGANLVELERLNALERQRVIEQVQGQQVAELQRFYESITFGALSGASPADSLSGSRASFLAAAAQAQAGDISARGRLAELGSQFLGSSRAFNASGAGFQSDLSLVQSAVQPFLDSGQGSVQDVLRNVGQALGTLQATNNNQTAEVIALLTAVNQNFARLSTDVTLLLNARAA